MGRPIYPYELNDPDFSWLISSFQESFPEYSFIENSCLPVVFIENHCVLSKEYTEEEKPDNPVSMTDEPSKQLREEK